MKIVCYRCLIRNEEGEWLFLKDIEASQTRKPKNKGKGNLLPSEIIENGERKLFKCVNCINSKKTKKGNIRAREKNKERAKLFSQLEEFKTDVSGVKKDINEVKVDLDKVKIRQDKQEEKITLQNKILVNATIKIHELDNKFNKPTNKELFQQHQRLKKWEDRNFNFKMRIKDFAPQFQKVVERRKKLDEYKVKVKNSLSFLYNNYTKEQIEQSQTIENINKLLEWNIWEPKTRKARYFYVGIPSVVLFVWFSIWKLDLIKKCKDWYNEPLEEENWE